MFDPALPLIFGDLDLIFIAMFLCRFSFEPVDELFHKLPCYTTRTSVTAIKARMHLVTNLRQKQ